LRNVDSDALQPDRNEFKGALLEVSDTCLLTCRHSVCCTTDGLVFGWGWAAVGQLGHLCDCGSNLCLTADVLDSTASRSSLDHTRNMDACSTAASYRHDSDTTGSRCPASQAPAAHLLHAFNGHSVLVLSRQHAALPANGIPCCIDTLCAPDDARLQAFCADVTAYTHCASSWPQAGRKCCGAGQKRCGDGSKWPSHRTDCVLEHEEHGLCVLAPLQVKLPWMPSVSKPRTLQQEAMHQRTGEATHLGHDTEVGPPCKAAWHALSVNAADWHTIITMKPVQQPCVVSKEFV
jgi:hypothetical protein